MNRAQRGWILIALQTIACGTHRRDFGVDSAGAAGTGGDGVTGSGGRPAGTGTAGTPGNSGGESESSSEGGSSGEAGVSEEAGVSGEGGTNGEGGAGGGAPLGSCVNAADCDDGLACNGTETCQSGQCLAGTPPCNNPDPVHCTASCSESGNKAICTVLGRDSDNDQHLSALCAAAPGDDCDDSRATVHPGAPELCDGIDNDCNGKADLSDTLHLSGTTTTFSGAADSTPSIAWAADRSVYGLLWHDASFAANGDVAFATVNQSGITQVAPELVNQSTTTRTSKMTYGLGAFGTVWADSLGLQFRKISSMGSFLSSVISISSEPFSSKPLVAGASDGRWAVLWAAYIGDGATEPAGTTLSSSGDAQMGTLSLSVGVNGRAHPSLTGVASTGATFAVVYDSPYDGSAQGDRLSAALDMPVPLTLSGTMPVIASDTHGYGVAVSSTAPALPVFYSFTANGSKECGPMEIGDANFVPTAIAPTADGYLIASSGSIRVQQVFRDCTLGALFVVDTGPSDSSVSIASGDLGYGVVWDSGTAGARLRLFGAAFCN